MLAGNMKLKNFLLIVSAVGIVGIGGTALMCSGKEEKTGEESRVAKPPVQTLPQPNHVSDPIDTANTDPVPDTVVPDTATDVGNLRDVDKELMSWIGKNLGSEKIKDAAKGHAWKINLYQDAGATAMGRAKVDLDRDDKWDEKWTFDGNNISRKVAPNDDEDYSQEFDWNGSDWTAR